MWFNNIWVLGLLKWVLNLIIFGLFLVKIVLMYNILKNW